jgi:pimeloyl-ACP methyl ester carboxylesterase
VFVSGLGGDHGDWGLQLPSHGKRFRCLVYDHRMIGQSRPESAPGGPCTISLLAADLAELLGALGIRQAHVVGASMGGAVALAFALDFPRMVRSLGLHSTLARTSALFRLKLAVQRELLGKLEVAEVLYSLAPLIWSEETLTRRPQVIERFRESRRERGPLPTREAYDAQARALMEFDVLARLGEIRVPTLVTAGSDDALILPADSLLIHRGVRGSEMHVFEGCGHAALAEKAEEFNAVSMDFLARQGGTPA